MFKKVSEISYHLNLIISNWKQNVHMLFQTVWTDSKYAFYVLLYPVTTSDTKVIFSVLKYLHKINAACRNVSLNYKSKRVTLVYLVGVKHSFLLLTSLRPCAASYVRDDPTQQPYGNTALNSLSVASLGSLNP